MKLPLQKSFRLLKFLNRNHPWWLRLLVTPFAWAAALVATLRPPLANEVARRCWRLNDFKLAARRGAWYFRRGWPNLDVSQDDFFDFTEGMDDRLLQVLEDFVTARRSRLPSATYAADIAFIAARRLDNASDQKQLAANTAQFEKASIDLLAHANAEGVVIGKTSKPRIGDFPVVQAQQTLRDFQALFPNQKLPWFLISGTFLGLIREGGFLPHDYDIDLGLFAEHADIASLRQEILQSDRFVLKKYDHHRSSLFSPPSGADHADVPYILKIIHVSGVHIDLFIHYRDLTGAEPIYWHGSSLHRWENSAFELKEYEFYDMRVLGPADHDAYLTENYGDWRTPVTDFNCTTDTPNLQLVRHPVAVAIFLKRYVINRSKDPVAAEKLKHSLLRSGVVQEQAPNKLIFSAAALQA